MGEVFNSCALGPICYSVKPTPFINVQEILFVTKDVIHASSRKRTLFWEMISENVMVL